MKFLGSGVSFLVLMGLISALCILLFAGNSFAGELNPKLVSSYEIFKNAIKCDPTISSGHRSAKKNKAVGGAKKSLHLVGKALDLKFPKCLTSLKDLSKIAQLYFNGVILYPNHIHVDVRDGIYYGTGTY